MGQTRVDLLHLLEDLRDAYPGDLEETILTEVVANSLDSGASRLSVLTDPAERTVVVADNGSGMGRRELSRYHDIASSTKTRGEGIGFAGVGIKLGLLVAEEVLTETRKGDTHVATRWHLASRNRAPWKWVPPPDWVAQQGTAVGLRLKNPLSPLLDPGYIEAALRRHFEPLFDHSFDEILSDHYPSGVTFVVNGQVAPKRPVTEIGRGVVVVRLPRKRKPAALGYLERSPDELEEDRQGIAVSTLGKVIRRGWDWIGLTSSSPTHVAGLIEAPALAAALTLNKGDFVRAGRRGIAYLAYRKAIQEAVAGHLVAWGEARDKEDYGPPSRRPAPGARPRDGARGPGRGLPGPDGPRGAARRGPATPAHRRRQRLSGGRTSRGHVGRGAGRRRDGRHRRQAGGRQGVTRTGGSRAQERERLARRSRRSSARRRDAILIHATRPTRRPRQGPTPAHALRSLDRLQGAT